MQRVPGPRPGSRGESARERLHRLERPQPTTSSSFLYAALLGVAVFLLVGALSVRQVTEPDEARAVLRAGIVTLTDIDLLLAQYGDDLRQLARTTNEDTVAIPGYPLDVRLTRQEALQSTDADLRQMILDRSTEIVYRSGLGSFDRTGDQSLSVFSGEGLLESLIGQLSETTHSRANIASVVLGALVVLLSLLALLRTSGYRRLGTLGAGFLGGALPGVLVFLGLRMLTGAGGDDAFTSDVREIVRRVIGVPLRNYVIVSLLGAGLAFSAIVLSLLSRRVAALQLAPAGDSATFEPPLERAPFVAGPRPGRRAARDARDEPWDDGFEGDDDEPVIGGT